MKRPFLPILNKQLEKTSLHDSWTGLDRIGRNAFIELYIRQYQGQSFIILCENDKRVKELSVLIGKFSNIPVLSIFEKSYLPVEILAKDEEKNYEKSLAMYHLSRQNPVIIVANVGALIEETPIVSYYEKSCLTLKVGTAIELDSLKTKLYDTGYQSIGVCEEKGSFSARGGLIDVYSPNYENPIRIEWFDDEIESIRFFSADTQKTVSIIQEVEIIPAQDFFYDASLREEIILSIKDELKESRMQLTSLMADEDIDENLLRYYAYKASNYQGNLLEYCAKNCTVIVDELERVDKQITLRYEFVFSQLEKLLQEKEILPSKVKSLNQEGVLKKLFFNLPTLCLSHIKSNSSFFDTSLDKQYYIHENPIKVYPVQHFLSELAEYKKK